jgi:hypothetical protein
MRDVQVFVQPAPCKRSVDLYLKIDGRWANDLCFVEVKEMEPVPSLVSLPELAAQDLIDRLWSAGLRPTEGSGSAGALAATERHLKDLQRLVFEE